MNITDYPQTFTAKETALILAQNECTNHAHRDYFFYVLRNKVSDEFIVDVTGGLASDEELVAAYYRGKQLEI